MSGSLWIHTTAKYRFPPGWNWENPQVPHHSSSQSYAGGVYSLFQEDKHSKGNCEWGGVYHNSNTTAKNFKYKKIYNCLYLLQFEVLGKYIKLRYIYMYKRSLGSPRHLLASISGQAPSACNMIKNILSCFKQWNTFFGDSCGMMVARLQEKYITRASGLCKFFLQWSLPS